MEEMKYIFNHVLLKLASRCNLKCDYCYWFKDDSVLEKPPRLTKDVESAFLAKLRAHILRYQLKSFLVLFHGGEPLLFGKQRFIDLCFELRSLEQELNVSLDLRMTTNGVLIDDEWASILAYYKVHVTVSLDPTPEAHDRHRTDFKGHGSYSRAFQGFALLRKHGASVSGLAVCDPEANPEDVYRHFIDELQLKSFDVLIPIRDHESEVLPISQFYIKLFDLWYDTYSHQKVEIRLFNNYIDVMLGGRSRTEGIGLNRVHTHTLLTDGSLEALDVLRVSGYRHTESRLNIKTHALQDSEQDPTWQEAYHAALNQPEICRSCRYRKVCGSGHIATRWSKERRYDNPSVYCGQLYKILSHIESRIFADIHYAEKTATGEKNEVRC
jgi:uncharacterized protein